MCQSLVAQAAHVCDTMISELEPITHGGEMAIATMEEMVSAVKAYAAAHYEEDGWDSIVECYSDKDIQAELEDHHVHTVDEAIWVIGVGAGIWNDRRKDIEAEAF